MIKPNEDVMMLLKRAKHKNLNRGAFNGCVFYFNFEGHKDKMNLRYFDVSNNCLDCLVGRAFTSSARCTELDPR